MPKAKKVKKVVVKLVKQLDPTDYSKVIWVEKEIDDTELSPEEKLVNGVETEEK